MDRPSSKKTGLARTATGIEGLDEITGGGLPTGRVTLVTGRPGSGKTVLALQTLVYGAQVAREPGIFVAFEENSRRLVANAATFGWNLPELEKRGLFFLDAQPPTDIVRGGGFDLQGLLAALDSKITTMKAKRLVLDSVDAWLDLLEDPVAQQIELRRLHDWLVAREVTALVTAKVRDVAAAGRETLDRLEFMVDCIVRLDHRVERGVSQRSLRVAKFRGSSFAENESPMAIGPTGLEVAGLRTAKAVAVISDERISTGVERLDAMLEGGYFRGSSVLVTGSPGTSKTTLSGAFAQAACARGERTLMVSFDSEAEEIVRNLASVNIQLERYRRGGLLRIHAVRSAEGSAETHLLKIRLLLREEETQHLIIDPCSAVGKVGNEGTGQGVVERLIDWAKARGITVICTSLLDRAEGAAEGTALAISTIADTWIHLSYLVQAGERNRALTIVKSRGTAHSNQVRELILSKRGVSLTDVYLSDGQVLMGTLRWQKEQADAQSQRVHERDLALKQQSLERARDELESQLGQLRRDLQAKEQELASLHQAEARDVEGQQVHQASLKRIRYADTADPAPPPAARVAPSTRKKS